ncbi:TetR family transcriptional regulator [Streptomyces sp. ACA25]|uniref:TetR/AcrR family transcriptional regulator n=1 Tax=Streptomyces sp. ACA25 TaxID=3022596 RepID=UPI0023071EFF|nr:TetR/AcrR family transcriptional regulator [Streptomyces sp. ACA25]MDB1088101.1 TetR family transcriptional regulator [Streptomyces sp. ACA25]
MTGRRDEVLDAAVEVVGSGGLRRLTYRAVDTAAGVPAGTTSNHFRSRDSLVQGVVAHLEALDRRDWEAFGGQPAPAGPDELAAAVARTVRHFLGPGRTRLTARYALLLEGIARPAVREPLARANASLTHWGARWLRELGSPAPEEHCEVLMDYLDGLMLHRVTMERADFDPEPGIRTVLSGFLPPPESR